MISGFIGKSFKLAGLRAGLFWHPSRSRATARPAVTPRGTIAIWVPNFGLVLAVAFVLFILLIS